MKAWVLGLLLCLAPRTTGPIGYWKLDDTASPSVDSISTADGIWSGAVLTSTDVPPPFLLPSRGFDDCGSLRFQSVAAAGGNVDYVTLGRSAALDTVQNGSFTLAAWVKPASLPPSTGSDTQYGIVLKGGQHEGLSLAGGGFVMGHWSDESPSGYYAAGYGNSNVTPGTWYHVVGVVDKTALKVRIYVNGAPPGVNPEVALPAGVNGWPIYNNEPWQIGIHIPNTSSTVRYQADAWIDDVRIYDRALTTTEITTLANGGTVGDPAISPPGTPGGLTATPSSGQVSLSWGAVTGATSYNVKRSTVGGAETQYAMATTNSFVDSAVTAGTTYFYVVSALVRCSEGSNSTEASATVPVPPPPAPRGPKTGGKDNKPCGCGSTATSGLWMLLAAVLSGALLVAYGRTRATEPRT